MIEGYQRLTDEAAVAAVDDVVEVLLDGVDTPDVGIVVIFLLVENGGDRVVSPLTPTVATAAVEVCDSETTVGGPRTFLVGSLTVLFPPEGPDPPPPSPPLPSPLSLPSSLVGRLVVESFFFLKNCL